MSSKNSREKCKWESGNYLKWFWITCLVGLSSLKTRGVHRQNKFVLKDISCNDLVDGIFIKLIPTSGSCISLLKLYSQLESYILLMTSRVHCLKCWVNLWFFSELCSQIHGVTANLYYSWKKNKGFRDTNHSTFCCSTLSDTKSSFERNRLWPRR